MIDIPKKRTSAKTDYVADQPIYLDSSGKVVGDKDPAKHTKLVHTGGRLPYDEAVRYGLIEVAAEETVAVVAAAVVPERAGGVGQAEGVDSLASNPPPKRVKK